MKKFKLFGVVLTLIGRLFLGNNAFAEEGIHVIYNGQEVSFDVKPSIKDGRTLVPFRKVFEVLGADVSWDDSSKTVTAHKGSIEIILSIGDKNATVNGQYKTLDVPPTIIDGRTVVPLRFVSENCGAQVDWVASTKSVSIRNLSEQEVISVVDSGEYQPIRVKKGIPVKLTFRVNSREDINGCNRTVVIPKYNITKQLTVGENIVEFTPTEEGTIPFSCGMGMIQSEITVVSP